MPPAACIGDTHVCPLYSGSVPHVGGAIAPASARSVLIGGRPAAILGDLAICATGPPAQLAAGSATVLINGQPAARVGDATSHGGVISPPGCPQVQIGG
ncbi:MAG: PAAR domain-containing protein [Chloroflexi bacterium]|nr:PAAR domain-containing protein [Chloroflexota bacterium]